MKLMGRDDLVLLYDPETGILRDINTVNDFCGAYCFHDQITESSYDFFAGVKNSTIRYLSWAKESVKNLNQNIDISWSYEWRGWNIVEKRIYYSSDMWIGLNELREDLNNPSGWYDLVRG